MEVHRIKSEIRKYMEKHPVCEACGAWVYPRKQPHHIVTRGAGGTDDFSNLLRLCHTCDSLFAHGLKGMSELIRKYPRNVRLREKLFKARPKLQALWYSKIEGDVPFSHIDLPF